MLLLLATLATGPSAPQTPQAALKASDVVFMYQADRATYQAYGATVLAWGGKPTPDARAAAEGVRWFGSVGMVTEFAAYHDRFPEAHEQGLCRDIDGKPVKVPWLTDHQHKGIPYWWCCTNQPNMRTYLRERVEQAIRAGADGLHIDDHLGTSGGLWLGICFCDRCVEGFRAHLKAQPPERLAKLGIADAASYDFRAEGRRWIAAGEGRNITGHPVWPEWTRYQHLAAAAFMQELRGLAATTAGRPVPVGANAGLLWPGQLSDYKAIDLFSAETPHHASERRMPDAPVLAYRMAEAVGRPYAATADGGDWAFIKEHGLSGLVRGWVALAYAAGQMLMSPHRQWCYTPEKGTHWYEGPAERYAPLYRFVRDNAGLFDGYRTHADVTVVLPYAAFRRDAGKWSRSCAQLSAANISYRIAIGGDDIVDTSVRAADLARSPVVLVGDAELLGTKDAQAVAERRKRPGVVESADAAIAAARPAVRVERGAPLRVFPRVRARSAVVHLVNFAYEAARDDVTPQSNVAITLNLRALGVGGARRCRVVRPDGPTVTLPVSNGSVVVPELGLWALLVIDRPTSR